MGLFDSIAEQFGTVLSDMDSRGQGGLMEVIADLIGNSEKNGIQGLINAFREKGLGDFISSWIGKGENQPISGDQLQAILGNEYVQAAAEKMGLSAEDLSGSLADLLPKVIDKLTPEGSLPEGSLIEQGLELLRSFGKQT
ncbi:MAG: YidB family protein [Desulfobacterales bacterium]